MQFYLIRILIHSMQQFLHLASKSNRFTSLSLSLSLSSTSTTTACLTQQLFLSGSLAINRDFHRVCSLMCAERESKMGIYLGDMRLFAILLCIINKMHVASFSRR